MGHLYHGYVKLSEGNQQLIINQHNPWGIASLILPPCSNFPSMRPVRGPAARVRLRKVHESPMNLGSEQVWLLVVAWNHFKSKKKLTGTPECGWESLSSLLAPHLIEKMETRSSLVPYWLPNRTVIPSFGRNITFFWNHPSKIGFNKGMVVIICLLDHCHDIKTGKHPVNIRIIHMHIVNVVQACYIHNYICIVYI
jgi:hypothetical protein